MNRERANRLWTVMKAYAEGRDVQMKTELVENWMPCHEPDWTAPCYRIKPEPKFRPWKAEEVPVGALFKFAGVVSVILSVEGNKLFFVKDGYITFNFLDAGTFYFSEHSLDHGKTWLPCGVMEDA